MSLSTKNLHYRKSGTNYRIGLYTDLSDVDPYHITLYIDGTKFYCNIIDKDITDFKVRLSGVTYSIYGYRLGDTGPAGGIVFYDKGSYSDGWRYLEACPYESPLPEGGNSDTSTFEWGGRGTVIGTSSGVGTGLENTQAIYAELGDTEPFNNRTDYAAKQCINFSHGGYSDWFLPSINELVSMSDNRAYLDSYEDRSYWSSTEYSSNEDIQVDIVNLTNGYEGQYYKDNSDFASIRPIRRF